jgi:hypothetical protein
MKLLDIINEQPTPEENGSDYIKKKNKVTNSQRNKVKLLYNTWKTGSFTVEDSGSIYKYVLADEYEITVDDKDNLCVIPKGNINPKKPGTLTNEPFKIYSMNHGPEEKFIPNKDRTNLYRWMRDNIKNKFDRFSINMILFVKVL